MMVRAKFVSWLEKKDEKNQILSNPKLEPFFRKNSFFVKPIMYVCIFFIRLFPVHVSVCL